MRFRIYRAFSGNNSGSYALVGALAKPEDAEALAAELDAVVRAHHEWLEAPANRREAAAPLERYAREQELEFGVRDWAYDEWPSDEAPRVVAAGSEVLVFVSCTITMPRLFGELVYRRGGRVRVEIDHAHERIVALFELWYPSFWSEREAARAAYAAFERAIDEGELADEEAPPALHCDGNLVTLAIAPRDIAEGVHKVGELARRHGLTVRFTLHESSVEGDALGPYRYRKPPRGAFQVVLWEAGDQPLEVLRVLRAVTRLELAEVKELLAKAPTEVLVSVDERTAREAADALKAAGARAEYLTPAELRGLG